MGEQIVEEKIIQLLKENIEELEDVELTPDTELIAGGYMESFEVIELITDLEKLFHIDISLDEIRLEEFNTPASIAGIVEKFSAGVKG